MFQLTVCGDPITKANATQARWSHQKRRTEVFIPEEFLIYEQLIKDAAIHQAAVSGWKCIESGPVIMNIDYYLGSRRKKDLLNLPKTTCDALNNIVYADDVQIVQSTCRKFYDKENPRVEITVFEYKGDLQFALPPSSEKHESTTEKPIKKSASRAKPAGSRKANKPKLPRVKRAAKARKPRVKP